MEPTYKPGTKVLYYQPGIDEIFSRWAGKKIRSRGDQGSLKEVTIKTAEYVEMSRGYRWIYEVENSSLILCDDDIREVVA
jgi:hypothetical protein